MRRTLTRRLAGALAGGLLVVGMLPTPVAAAGAATHLAFGAQPANTSAGQPISPAITVQVEDATGAVVTGSTATVTAAILSNPGGGTLTGTLAEDASSGVATFGDLSIDAAGVGYTLVATSRGLTGATSAGFTIIGPAAKLAFGTQPTNTAANATMSPAVTVLVEDANGTVVPGDTSSVSLAITNGTGTAGAALSGGAAVNAVNGVATFGSLTIDKPGSGYTLSASDGSLSGATSGAFTIVGPAATLAFGTQPTNTVANATISPAVTVLVEDAGGNVVQSSSASVTLAIGTNPGGGTLSGTKTVSVSGGVATFSDLSINNAGAGYTLSAASGSLTGATSGAFAISASTQHLGFTTQPGGGAAGTIWSQQPVVAVEDANGYVVTTDSTTVVYLSISTNPAGGTLSCTSGTSLEVTNGIASFSGCSISIGSSSYYTLSATSSPAWTSATSGAFLVSGSAEHLVFTTQPGGGAAGTIWSQQPVVAVEDVNGTIVTGDYSTVVYLSISTNPAGGTLSCTSGTGVTVTSGVATFYGCSIGIGSSSSYTLSASSSPSWTSATSGAFLVGGGLTQVTLTDTSAAGINRGTSGFGTKSLVVTRHGYVTLLVMTSPNLTGAHLQIWAKSRTGSWHLLTTRIVAANGTVHYYARITGWTAFRARFVGDASHAAAWGPGRIATNPT
jgi:hypothetical protein